MYATLGKFERAIKDRKTVLASWYPKALEELIGSEEAGMFKDLVEAAEGYMKR